MPMLKWWGPRLKDWLAVISSWLLKPWSSLWLCSCFCHAEQVNNSWFVSSLRILWSDKVVVLLLCCHQRLVAMILFHESDEGWWWTSLWQWICEMISSRLLQVLCKMVKRHSGSSSSRLFETCWAAFFFFSRQSRRGICYLFWLALLSYQ